jgi:hypothetical protein
VRAVIVLALACAVASPLEVRADAPPVPAGSRRDGDRYASSRPFGAAVDYYRRELSRRGWAHRQVGPYRARGVDVARFVLDAPAGDLLAVHVYRQDGKTWISFVLRTAGSTSPSPHSP